MKVVQVLDAVRALPGGATLLRVAHEGVHVVGGTVRDLLRGETPRELDVVVEGEVEPLIEALGGSRQVLYDRFETATVTLRDGARIDVARSRRECYPQPGALPEVEPAPLVEDLARRDFSVNAIAVSLSDGRLTEVEGALDDLAARRLRVLHESSFIDDPTRILRLARYAVRLGFEPEPHTAELAAAATYDGVSLARIGAELRLALAEANPLAVLSRIEGLPLAIDEPLACAALALRPEDARLDLLLLACATLGRANDRWLDGLEFAAAHRDIVLAAWRAPELARAMEEAHRPSELAAVLWREPPEAVALAGALGPAEAARKWLGEFRHVKLEIGGDDLIAAGIEPGPELGAMLRGVLRRKLDGEIGGGREAELAAALSAQDARNR